MSFIRINCVFRTHIDTSPHKKIHKGSIFPTTQKVAVRHFACFHEQQEEDRENLFYVLSRTWPLSFFIVVALSLFKKFDE